MPGIVVNHVGSIGWIVGYCGEIDLPPERCRFIVFRADRRAFGRVDHGLEIDPRSLTLHGSRMSWVDGGRRRSTVLR